MPRLIVLCLLGLAACSQQRDYSTARALIGSRCAACHTVPGVEGATGLVGPPLAGIAKREIIAGRLPNTPANLRHFLQHPQSVVPGGGMPELGLTPKQSAVIADYLYTLDRP